MKINRLFIASFVAVAALFAFQASDTYACPKATPTPAPSSKPKVKAGINWTSLNMNQTQGFVGNHKPVKMYQSGVGETATYLGDHAMSSSKHFAKQALQGAPTKAKQQQSIVSGARTEFQANKVPSWTTAGTMGKVSQNQNAWSAYPLDMYEAAGTHQVAQVGENKSVVKGQEEQKLKGVTGDPYQKQNISGSSQAQGYTSMPFPQMFTFGNTFRQVVDFNVENIFTF